MKKIALFGSTGSVGLSTLSIVRENPELFSVQSLVAGSQLQLLVQQAREFRPQTVGIHDSSKASELKELLLRAELPCTVAVGADEIAALAADSAADIVVGAIVGIAGLASVHRALKAGKTVALANKESLVCGGELLTSLMKHTGGKLIPVDSEHSALFQSLVGNRHEDVAKLVLTASGGPFLHTSIGDLKNVTPEMALKHPRWKMGAKITIDSSTMFNKSLEVIEAHWLFDIPEEKIDVVVHPQSIIHSLVSYKDGSSIAQLSRPDMRGPIAYALTYPNARLGDAVKPLDFATLGALEFLPLDLTKFPAVELAREVLRQGGGAGVVFNAANEVAVERFLAGKIEYLSIFRAVKEAVDRFQGCRCDSLQSILELDREVRLSIWD